MEKCRVLIIAEDTIFSNAIELLLVLQENLEIVGAVSPDIEVISAQIKQTQPSVVIINDDIATANAQLVVTLLNTYSHLRIIAFNLDNNRINVYDNRQVDVTTVDDLVSAITEIHDQP